MPDQVTFIGPGFAMLPDALLHARDVSDRAVRLWCVLYRCQGLREGAVPSLGDLAGDLGCSESSVYRARLELEDAGWLAIVRRVERGDGTVLAVEGDLPRADGGRFTAGAAHPFVSCRYVLFGDPIPDPEAQAEAIARAIPEGITTLAALNASPDGSPQDPEAQTTPAFTGEPPPAFTRERRPAFTGERLRETHSDSSLAEARAREASGPLPALTAAQTGTLAHLGRSVRGLGFALPRDWGAVWVLRGLTASDVDQALAEGAHITAPRSRLGHLGRTLERAAQDRAAGRPPWAGAVPRGSRREGPPDLQAAQRAMVPGAPRVDAGGAR